ncbi:hypothetical protein RCL_jg7847.t1 [Rhizophagus clarus]|uniref:Uncharacterized protein n=1 Tax=Rhizophagus clarus TaxID=94130 RepID=A0A8H3R543_9GLOM|nr:hypothetical protein RCL_jg7847.t1 [Rhizophagus clarus]
MAEERLITQDRIYDQQQRQKQKYDKNIKEQYYKIGDLVLLYKIRENGMYKLWTMEGKILKVPVSSERLKQYYSCGDLDLLMPNEEHAVGYMPPYSNGMELEEKFNVTLRALFHAK